MAILMRGALQMSDEEKKVQGTQDSGDSVDQLLFFERGLLTEFQVTVPAATSGATAIPLTTTATPIAFLSGPDTLNIDDPFDRVWLTATIGWSSTAANTVTFTLSRNTTSTPIFSTRDSAFGVSFNTTTITFVDTTPISVPGEQPVSYILTALTDTAGAATIIGPIVLTGAEIERNRLICP